MRLIAPSVFARALAALAALALLTACGAEPSAFVEGEHVEALEQAVTRWGRHGEEQQGTALLGESGPREIGVRVTGGIGSAGLSDIQVIQGELIAKRTDVSSPSPYVVRGGSLVGARLFVDTLAGTQQVSVVAVRRATLVEAGAPAVDPTGATWLYRLVDSKTKKPFCKADSLGRVDAVPVAARWDEHGDRVERSSADRRFSFACVRGVVAKCYGWGYRPWESSELRDLHQTCTRAARADYCGDGISRTCDGTPVNFFDLPAAVLGYEPLPGFLFEAGWTPSGAKCLSKNRWDTLPAPPFCTDFARRGPYTPQLQREVCDSAPTVRARFPEAHVLTESTLRPWPESCAR